MRSLIAAMSAAAVLTAGAVALAAPASATPATPSAAQAGAYVPVSPARRVLSGKVVAAHSTTTATVSAGATGVPSSGVGAVATTISVLAPTATGAVVAYATGASRPGTANVQFTAGQRASDLAVVAPGSSGSITLYNNSGGTVSLSVDISGYYVAGASLAVKSYHPVKAARVVNGNINANASVNPVLGGRGGLPRSGVGAVAVTISEFKATRSGYLTAGAYNLPITPARVVHWSANQRAASFAIVPVDADGTMALHNASSGRIQVTVDVVGYYRQGAPYDAGMLDNVPAASVLSPTPIGSGATKTIGLFGQGGIARTGVRAVVLTVGTSSAASGALVVYPGGSTRPGTANVQFAGAHTTSNVVVVALSASGTVTLYNGAAATVNVAAYVTGWVLDQASTAPPTQVGRYVRNIKRGQTTDNQATMRREGQQDANSDLVLLDIGAQSNDKTGVQLSSTSDSSHKITYQGLVLAVNAYVEGYADAGGTGRVAVGTSNSADDWTHYTAAQRGTDWATKVINAIDVPSGVTIVGADDIEPGFGTRKVTDAVGWKNAYRVATTANLIVNGSADDCPTSFGALNGTCFNGWTEMQLNTIAGGARTTVLPQMYNSRMPIQWTNINATGVAVGRAPLVFEGALTEFALGDSYPPEQGWAGLFHALQTRYSAPSLPYVLDLQSDED